MCYLLFVNSLFGTNDFYNFAPIVQCYSIKKPSEKEKNISFLIKQKWKKNYPKHWNLRYLICWSSEILGKFFIHREYLKKNIICNSLDNTV